MASPSEEDPPRMELVHTFRDMAAQRRDVKARNLGFLALMESKSTPQHERKHSCLNHGLRSTDIHPRHRGFLGIKNDDRTSSISASPSAGSPSSEAKTHDDLLEMGLVIVKSHQAQNDEVAPSPTLSISENGPLGVLRCFSSSVRFYQAEVGDGAVGFELISADEGSAIRPANKNRHLRHLGDLMLNRDDQLAVETLLQNVEKNSLKLDASTNKWGMKHGAVIRCDVEKDEKVISSATFISVPNHAGEVWLLIVNDTGVAELFTYGSPACQEPLFKMIKLKLFKESSRYNRVVQVTEKNGLKFQLPIEQCRTFMQLQSAIQCQFEEMDPEADATDHAVGSEVLEGLAILRRSGKPITSVVWSRMLQAWSSILRVKIKPNLPGYLPRSRTEPTGGRARDFTTKDIREETQEMPDEQAAHSIESSIEDEGFVIVNKSMSEDQHQAESELPASAPPTLEPRAPMPRASRRDTGLPPIFLWSSKNDDRNPGNEEVGLTESIEARFRQAGLRLRQYFPLGFLQEQPPDSGVNSRIAKRTFKNLKKQIRYLMNQEANSNGPSKVRFQEQQTLLQYHELCQAAIRFLEAFVPKNVSSPGLYSLYRALYEGLKAPRIRPKTFQKKWVVMRKSASGNVLGLKDRYGSYCMRCSEEFMYDSEERALNHVRVHHYADLPPGEEAENHVLERAAAAQIKLNETYAELVKKARDFMVPIADAVGSIQDAMVCSRQIQQPPWRVLSPLLESFDLTVMFLFAICHALNRTFRFFDTIVFLPKVRGMALSENPRRVISLMDEYGYRAEHRLSHAQRPLASITHEVRSDDLAELFVPVGVHELATQMVCNLLTGPVDANSQAENEWRQQLLSNVRIVFSKDAYRRRGKLAQVKNFPVQKYILDQAEKELQGQLKIIASSHRKLNRLRGISRQLINIIENPKATDPDIVFGIIYTIFVLGNFGWYLRTIRQGLVKLEFDRED
ncbi:unnamed protein product [Clonostachys rosea]|uniref:C2H2-type domain-containing protein n=1 Tax=Bionectria ochroleuca TaxID=29856 RepID=A0ABY6UG27_BIOOC|nr:unnamed protein product [Clonostachys rosea]